MPARVCGGSSRVHNGRAALGREGSPACDVPASGTAYGQRYLAQKNKGGTGVLTAGRDRVVGLCREADVDGEVDTGVLRASGTHDPVRACSMEVQRGSDRTTVHQRRGIAAAGRLTHGDARHNPAELCGGGAAVQRPALMAWKENVQVQGYRAR